MCLALLFNVLHINLLSSLFIYTLGYYLSCFDKFLFHSKKGNFQNFKGISALPSFQLILPSKPVKANLKGG